MQRICFALPVLPGKSEVLREFEKTRTGPRSQERDAFEEHFKTSRQIDWLQRTPKGDLVLVYYEVDADVKQVLEEFIRVQGDYAGWVRSKWSEVTGVDLNDPSSLLRLNSSLEQVFAYEGKGAATVGMRGVCLAMPVVPGKLEVARKFYRTRTGPRWQEEEVWRKEGFKTSREFQWLQNTPQGELLLVYGEWGGDFKERAEEFTGLQDEYSRWVKGKLSEITGIDLNKPFLGPLPEEIYSYEAKEVVTVPQ